ncbi:hypothetical protein [Streptomyces sp. NPDC052496]|uniref:hypothetical protein n=1 Tax=Streptomyces sp. NPDC052496 TaxID=3154951 RepID=UPI003445376D
MDHGPEHWPAPGQPQGLDAVQQPPQAYRFNHLRLGGHKTVRVHTGRGHDNLQRVFQNRRDHVWDSKRDVATLRDQHRHAIDTESWGRRCPPGDVRGTPLTNR